MGGRGAGCTGTLNRKRSGNHERLRVLWFELGGWKGLGGARAGRARRGKGRVSLVRALGLYTPGRGDPASGSMRIALIVNL